jgi:hypothetical protein
MNNKLVSKQFSTGGFYAIYYWYKLMSSVGLAYLSILPFYILIFSTIIIEMNVEDPTEYFIYSLLSSCFVMASFPFLAYIYLKKINKLREAEISYFKVWYMSFLWLLSFVYMDEIVRKVKRSRGRDQGVRVLDFLKTPKT